MERGLEPGRKAARDRQRGPQREGMGAETGKELLSLNKYDVHSIAWSPDGKRLATGSEDYTARVWDAETGKELFTLDGPTGQVTSVAWSPDGKRLATGSGGHTAKVWDARTGKELFALGDANARIWTVAWSPNGERLAVASYTTQVQGHPQRQGIVDSARPPGRFHCGLEPKREAVGDGERVQRSECVGRGDWQGGY